MVLKQLLVFKVLDFMELDALPRSVLVVLLLVEPGWVSHAFLYHLLHFVFRLYSDFGREILLLYILLPQGNSLSMILLRWYRDLALSCGFFGLVFDPLRRPGVDPIFGLGLARLVRRSVLFSDN